MHNKSKLHAEDHFGIIKDVCSSVQKVLKYTSPQKEIKMAAV